MTTSELNKKARVLIAGGGVAGLEAAIALHEIAGDRAEVTICSPREDFIYRPFAVAEPYGASRPMRYDLAELAERCGATYRRAGIDSVDSERRRARTRDGEELAYDYLIVACGSRLLASVSGATIFWGVADDSRVQDLFRDLQQGRLHRVVFTMPGGATWALPMYELALLAQSELAKHGVEDASLLIVTPEDAPLHLFGRAVSERISALLAERGIELVTAAMPIHFEDGRLAVSPRASIEADAVLSLPRIEGRRISGVPHDLAGLVPVDQRGRVRGLARVFAAGDATTFSVKQGGVAAQQADVVAETIASELGCDVEVKPFDPILRGVLWTGAEPLYLSGFLAGGHGEASSVGEEPAWQGGPDDKIVARYLSPFLTGIATVR
jgi:sulfide:quinone oxidoreductase